MTPRPLALGALCLASLAFLCVARPGAAAPRQEPAAAPHAKKDEHPVQIHYLEIVTPKVAETCAALERAHGVTFGEPVPEFGNARTATLRGGGRLGVRGPLRSTETPVVRPYILVEDIDAAIGAAEAAGGEVAMPPTEIPGQGRFAIYVLGGIEHGLWQL